VFLDRAVRIVGGDEVIEEPPIFVRILPGQDGVA
jgi:hypothetical protein